MSCRFGARTFLHGGRCPTLRTHKLTCGIEVGVIHAPKQRGQDERALLADRGADGAAAAVFPEGEEEQKSIQWIDFLTNRQAAGR